MRPSFDCRVSARLLREHRAIIAIGLLTRRGFASAVVLLHAQDDAKRGFDDARTFALEVHKKSTFGHRDSL